MSEFRSLSAPTNPLYLPSTCTSARGLSGRRRKEGIRVMSIWTIIIILLVIALLGGFSGVGGGPFYGTGYYGGGGLGIIIIILVVLLLMGRL